MWAWAFGSSQYVRAAVKNVEEYLSREENKQWKMPAKAEMPLQTTYRPELDVSPELDATESAYYQSLIGVLRWMVELGRVDISIEVSMMSSHLVLPREGHLEQVLHIFAHLKKYHNNEADLLTKLLPSGEKRKGFVRKLLHHIFRTEGR